MNIEIGLNKKVRRAYGIDEIALVPGTRTLDYDLTDPSWLIGDLKREVPIVASAMAVSYTHLTLPTNTVV